MDDQDFFDHLYQVWSKTTGSGDRFWVPEEHFDKSGRHNVYAVSDGETRKLIASGMSEVDSDFVTALHGCLPDLVRRLGEALDEADRADFERDSRECRIAELESEVAELKRVVDGLSTDPPWTSRCG